MLRNFKLKQTVVAFLIFAFAATSIPASTYATESESDTKPIYLAKNKGPILWYVRDPEKKQAMENDMELWKMYNEAQKAKKRRYRISSALFYPGLAILAVGVSGGLFQNAIGLWDEETGEAMLVYGTLAGTALITPGIVFRAKKSKAEKAYLEFVKEKYNIIPILQRDRDDNALYGVAFKLNF